MNRFLFLVLWGFYSCSNIPKDEVFSDLSQVSENIESKNKRQSKNNETDDSYNIVKFKTKIDYVLNKSKNSEFSQILDTLPRGGLVFVELKNTPLKNVINESVTTIKYSFRENQGISAIKLHLVIIAFNSEQKAENIFRTFEKVSIEKNGVPGLTYSNDYLVKVKNKIYWINSACTISYFNHCKIVNEFKDIFHISAPKSIQCECGQVICELYSD